jgi:hypothetical protein
MLRLSQINLGRPQAGNKRNKWLAIRNRKAESQLLNRQATRHPVKR